MPINEGEKKFITPKEAADISSYTRGALANLRHRKHGCKYYKRGSKVLYDRLEFEAWLKSNPVLTIDALESVS